MSLPRLIKTPVLLFFMSVMLVFSPFSALAEESSPPDQVQQEEVQAPSDEGVIASFEEEAPLEAETPTEVESSSEVETTSESGGNPPQSEVKFLAEASVLSADPTFHLDIAIELTSSHLWQLPTFEVGLADANAKLLGKATASEANFNKDAGVYELTFQLKEPLKVGDKYHIAVLSGTPEVAGCGVQGYCNAAALAPALLGPTIGRGFVHLVLAWGSSADPAGGGADRAKESG